MLGKLVKFDLKYGMKIFILLHGILIALSVLGRFLFMDRLSFADPDAALISRIVLFASVMLFLFMAVCFCTWLIITFRFYRNLFTGEGYLSWTLPAPGIQHLWAKIFSGCILYALGRFICAGLLPVLVPGSNVPGR